MNETGLGGIERLLTRRRLNRPVTLPDLADHLYAAILDAIRQVWLDVRRDLGALGGPLPQEEQITALLQDALEDLRHAGTHGFCHEAFDRIARGAKTVTLAGDGFDKAPDLTITPRAAARGQSLAVECKIVDATHGASLYIRQGMARFVAGEYACDMPSALMLAYCEPHRTVEDTLTPLLMAWLDDATIATRALPVVHDTPCAPHRATYRSEHMRSKRDQDGRTPGPIRLLHLWLPTA